MRWNLSITPITELDRRLLFSVSRLCLDAFTSRDITLLLRAYSQIPLRYLVRTSFEPASNQLRTN